MGSEGWSLGDELVALLRRWYLLSAAALLGGLAGWLIAWTLPPVYEAEALLSVSFTSDAFYLTPDDYKHQQLAELEDLTRTDSVLADTLARLGPDAPTTVRALRGRLDPRWRNAGAWQLAATAGDPVEARAIAGAWREAVYASATEAISHAAAFNELDRQLTAAARELEQASADLRALGQAFQDVEAWLADPETHGGDAGAALLGRRAAALLLHSGTAPEGDPLETGAVAWLTQAAAALRAEVEVQENLLAGLHADYDALGDEWLAEQRLSNGLSAYLVVEMPENGEIAVERLVSSASLSLAGAALGALGYAGYRLVGVLRRMDRGNRRDL